jgi:integrase
MRRPEDNNRAAFVEQASVGWRTYRPAESRLYDLSHTCATLLLSSNIRSKYVQELLGHASIAQTLDTYSHVLEGMDGGIGDAMDATIG